MIAERGIAETSHRAVAARADVPLGSTTYYFPGLDDMLAEALARSVTTWIEDLERRWDDRRSTASLDSLLVATAAEYLADAAKATVELELYVAAARKPQLRPLARAWVEKLTALLVTVVDGKTARTLAMLVDGAVIQALVQGRSLDSDLLAEAIRRLVATAGESEKVAEDLEGGSQETSAS